MLKHFWILAIFLLFSLKNALKALWIFKKSLKNHQKIKSFSKKSAKNEENPFTVYHSLFIADKR